MHQGGGGAPGRRHHSRSPPMVAGHSGVDAAADCSLRRPPASVGRRTRAPPPPCRHDLGRLIVHGQTAMGPYAELSIATPMRRSQPCAAPSRNSTSPPLRVARRVLRWLDKFQQRLAARRGIWFHEASLGSTCSRTHIVHVVRERRAFRQHTLLRSQHPPGLCAQFQKPGVERSMQIGAE